MHHTAKRHTTTHAAQLSLLFDSSTFVDVQHMVEPGFLQLALFIVALLVLVVVCALFQGRPRPHAYSQEELAEIRIDRELAKESMLEERAQKLRGRARIHRHNRLILTTRKDAGRILQGAQDRWDARGRSIYGDAWDDPQEGNLPLRTLFNIPSEELDSVREEASRLLREAEIPAHSHLSLPTPPGHVKHVDDGTRDIPNFRVRKTESGSYEHRAMTASARRGPAYSRPSTDAPFVDTRFVSVPTPAIVPPLDFTRLHDAAGNSRHLQPLSRPQTTAAPIGGGELHDKDPLLRDGHPGERNPMRMYRPNPPRQNLDKSVAPAATNTVGDDIASDGQPLPKHTSPASEPYFQEPGLTHPKPPDIPVPRATTKTQGMELTRESLSARLARLSAGRNSGRVVPIELV